MRRIGLFGRFSRPAVAQIISQQKEYLARRHEVYGFDLEGRLPEKAELDLAVIFGGDGTILTAARYLAPLGIGAIGVNLGKFGFLAGCVKEQCPGLIEEILDGKLHAVERTMLSARIERDGGTIDEMTALNDIVVTASVPAQMIAMKLSLNADYIATIEGDGIIVATATGSTGYNLSSGGPLVTPTEDVIILTALSPHTLAIRPMVISGDHVVDIEMFARRDGLTVTADGQVHREMENGDHVEIRRAPYRFRLYEAGDWSFYKVVRSKLRWGEELNYAKDHTKDNC